MIRPCSLAAVSLRVLLVAALGASVLIATPMPAQATHDPSIAISDVTALETDGSTTFSFDVTVSSVADIHTVEVDWATTGFSATPGEDYEEASGTLTFLPGVGEATQSIDITVNGDTTIEPDEVFFVGLSNPTGGHITDAEASGTIQNDDGPALSIADATAPESDGTMTFTVTKSEAYATPVAVDYTTASGTATEGTDFADATDTLTIPSDQLSASFTVPIISDTIDESDETFTVTLSNPTAGATIADATATGTITDDDSPALLTLSPVSRAEGDPALLAPTTTFTFEVEATGSTAQAITFDYATQDGTATAGSDYTATSGSGIIAADDADRMTTIDVTVSRDTTPEAFETFTVRLSNVQNADAPTPATTGTIENDDAVLSIGDAEPVIENSGDPAVFAVSIPFPTINAVTASYATSDGTATAPGDFTAETGTVTIPAGSTDTTVDVAITPDALDEADTEAFTVSLSSPSGATLGDGSATGTIVDDDDLPVVSITDEIFPEGQAGELTHQVTVSLDTASARTVTMDWATQDGTATTADGDYDAGSGSLSIPAGSTSATIDVTINGDVVAEADETFQVVLTNVANAAEGKTTGIVTIDNDDNSLAIEDATVNEGAGSVDVTVRLGQAPQGTETVTVDYATSDGTATAGDDYTTTSGTVTFTAGETVKTITVAIVDDATAEGSEDFTVTLSNPQGAVLPSTSSEATVTILDDETVILSVLDASVAEGDSGDTTLTFTVSLSAATGTDVTFDWATADGTATGDTLLPPATNDYEPVGAVLPAAGTITAGTTSTTLDVTVHGDTDEEPHETLTVTVTNVAGVDEVQDDVAEGTILNDDATVTVAPTSVTEGDAGTATGSFLVTLSSPVAHDVSLTHVTDDDTAVAPGDYVDNDGTLIIPAGQTTGTIDLSAVGDTVDESDETVTLTVTDVDTADNVVIDADDTVAVQGTIIDDDAPPVLSLDDVTVTEGAQGTTTDAVLTVSLSNASSNDVTVAFATADGTATAGSDYASKSDTLTIAAGLTSGTITVVVAGDDVDEADESFSVSLSNSTNASIGAGTGTVTITDDDEGELSIAGAAVTEGDTGTNPMTFVVTLSATAPGDVTFQYDTSDDTATAGSDYTAVVAGTGTIPAGSTTTEIAVDVLGDQVTEPNETFSVTLSNPAGASIAEGVATGLITDDDPRPPTADAGTYPTVVEGTSTTFDGSGSTDPDGQVVGWSWNFGDGTTGTGSSVAHAYDDEGSYTVTLTVTDDEGNTDTDSTTVTVTNGRPTIDIGGNRGADTLQLVPLTASVDDPGADTLTVSWAFGDGSTGSGTAVTHRWTAEGTYTVTATVSDGDGGSATDSIQVFVRDLGLVSRSAGEDRILTAVDVSRDHWDSAPDAILARADLFADALAAGPLAAELDAPLLLTNSLELPEAVEDELSRLDADRIWILGGGNAVSSSVQTRLTALGYDVRRLGGDTRYDTAAMIAGMVGRSAAGEVVVALGNHLTDPDNRAWPDAVSAGALSASPDRLPVLLTEQGQVPEATVDALADQRTTTVWLLGGNAAIFPSVEAQLAELGYIVRRLEGPDRYATSVAVAQEALRRHPAGQVSVIFATGLKFPDGLAAGALAARLGGIVVLVPPDSLTSTPGTAAFLQAHADRFDRGVVVGGAAVITDAVRAEVSDAMTTD